MLREPRAAFNTYSRIVADKNALDVLNSSLFYKLLWLRKKHHKLFRKIDTITSKITTLIKNK
jgi:sugar (pentulose or hexulose) kinase